MSDVELARIDDAAPLQSLREALVVESFEDFVCMCPGDLALEFKDEVGRRLTVVRIDSPGAVDWPWSSAASESIVPSPFSSVPPDGGVASVKRVALSVMAIALVVAGVGWIVERQRAPK